ncbi:MAG: AAA family ATPase [Candidatus Micrarchaeota archaeon]|nr:AAA family ATPase [Candidatus Micrarchaeota archaeon]
MPTKFLSKDPSEDTKPESTLKSEKLKTGEFDPVLSQLVKKSKGGTKFKSLKDLRFKAMLKEVEENTAFANALLVMAGCFFLLITFPLYPVWLIPFILLLVGFIAYHHAPLGTMVSTFIAFPAVAYQSPLFAWFFTIVISLTLLLSFTYWHIISLLFILVLAPFNSMLGFFVPPLLMFSTLFLGSKKGSFVTFVAVLLVLILSVMWGRGTGVVDNSAFIVYNPTGSRLVELYDQKGAEFSAFAKRISVPDVSELGNAMVSAFGNIYKWDSMQYVGSSIDAIMSVLFILAITDSALVQLFFWTAAMFLAGSISGLLDRRYKNSIASTCSLLIPIGYWLSCAISEQTPDPFVFLSTSIGMALVFFLEHNGVDISREVAVNKMEKMGKFKKFGIQDLSLSPGVESLDDIGDYDETKKELVEAILWPLTKKELSTAYGLKPPKGILLFGPPGTGKTMIMRALSREMKIGFYYVKCSDLLSEWYGESERNVSELFRIARTTAPCVLFFDEIDAIGRSRDKYTSDDVAPRLMALFLSEMDGFKSIKNVILVGATNMPGELDRALLRPGRFDKIIYMPLPDKEGRKEIFEIHTKNFPLCDDINFDKLAEKTGRYSGADIQNICMEAARKVAKLASETNEVIPVSMEHFISILSTIKPSVSISDLEEYEKFKLDFERRSAPQKEKGRAEKTRWGDVIGLDDVRQLLVEAIELPLLHEDILKEYHVTPIKGILLFGPPGCGKTMIVKAASNELNVAFIHVSGADLMKRGYSGAVSVIKESFNRARERAPALVFIDEIDSLAPSRDYYASPENEKVVAQLLDEMDGVSELKQVMFIAATNKPERIDPALLRPGRFDRIILIPPPMFGNRKNIFQLNLEGIPLEKDFNFDALAAKSEGFTGADIASVCQEAKMELVRSKLSGRKAALTMDSMKAIISKRRPSVTVQHLQTYIKFLEEYGERR